MVAGKTYLYTYDNAGNITSKKTYPYTIASTASLASTTATATYTYTYDSNWGDRLSSYRGASFAYDSLGNPTSYYNGSSYTMRWQKGRQLSVITKGSNNFGFTYDAEGRRTSKLSFSGRVIEYLWDGDLLVGEYIENQKTVTYVYDATGAPIGFTYTDLTGYYEGGAPCTFLYRKNMQGDIIGIVDSSGNEFVKYNYDAWGNLISYTMHGDGLYSLHYNMAEDNPFRYRGYYFDRETGFYYLNSRYYDPAIGRFINADSYINANGDLIGYNMYAYCNNNPVNMIDPTGEGFWSSLVKFAKKVAKKVENFLYNIDDAVWNSIEAKAGIGFGIGGNISNNITAEMSRDTYVGIDDGEIITGNQVTSEASIVDSIGIGDTYDHVVERDGKRVSSSGNASDGPFDMVNYPDVTHGSQISLGFLEINSNGELLISFGVSAHLVFGGCASVSLNITELFERLFD